MFKYLLMIIFLGFTVGCFNSPVPPGFKPAPPGPSAADTTKTQQKPFAACSMTPSEENEAQIKVSKIEKELNGSKVVQEFSVTEIKNNTLKFSSVEDVFAYEPEVQNAKLEYFIRDGGGSYTIGLKDIEGAEVGLKFVLDVPELEKCELPKNVE